MLNCLARTKTSSREGKAFTSFHLKRFSAEPAGGQNRPPSHLKHKRHHGRFPASPNMAQTPLCSSAVPLRYFPAIYDLTDAIFACIPPRQRKIFAAGRLLDAGGVLEAINDVPRTSRRSRGATDDCQCRRLPRRRSCCSWGCLPIGTMRHCAIYRVEMSRSPCDRS